ncbi:MAG: hypothetical protein ACPGLY_13515 [Rubripirellula sp.]
MIQKKTGRTVAHSPQLFALGNLQGKQEAREATQEKKEVPIS